MPDAFVVQAALVLSDGCDPRAVGAAVTTELCGDYDHDGACRWPHNNAIDDGRQPARFRTLFVADETDEPAVRYRVELALRRTDAWRVVSIGSRPVSQPERQLADRLLAGPRDASAG